MNILHQIKDMFSEHAYTNTLATIALAAPVWRSWLENVSSVASLLLPFGALLWFGVQIWAKIYRNK